MRFFNLNAKTRISLGLVCMLLSVISLAMMLGIVPERDSAIRQGRANLCETIAFATSDYISHGESRRLDRLLESVVQRDNDVISAGIRRANGRLVSVFGEHESLWPSAATSRSTDQHVRVPIRQGQTRWGEVELCFRPLKDPTWLGTATDPWVLMTAFVCFASFILFQLYLKKMLAHLDPSKSVPKRVKQALDTMTEGLLVLDRQFRIVLPNQAFANWIGVEPESLLGQKIDDLGWDFQHVDRTPWKDALTNEVVVAGVMIELDIANVPCRTLNANASPVFGQQGKVRGVLVSFDDVTQLEETKRDLTVAKRAADDANQAKSEFLARMSHEIRTPMNAILGYTDVLRRGFDTNVKDRQEYLDTIHGSGEHLLALINDILDLSKVESGQMELEIGPCAPHRLIKEVIALLKSRADEKSISLEFHGIGRLPKSIQCDAVRLRQALMNLAGNAIKFTDEGGVQITARIDHDAARHRDDRNLMLAIDVTDSGIGISEAAQAKVFEPFAQADTSITRRFGGTGLGLAISKQLAEAMGGEISLKSKLGEGTTFTIRIAIGSEDELDLVDADQLIQQDEEQAAKPTETMRLPECNILVADDGSPNRKLMRLVLSQAGANVQTVENGQLAIEAIEESDFDIVLMDMQMPVMDGYTATRTLRERGYEKPIFALTANAMQGDQEKCLAAGCSGFMTKPIEIDRLLAVLANELQSNANGTDGTVTTSPSSRALPDSSPSEVDESDQMDTVSMDEMIAGGDTDELDFGPIHCSYPLDDPDFLEIAEDFVNALRERLPLMDQLFQQSDLASLAAEAHWLKGVGGSAGFDQFASPSFALEHAAKANDLESCRQPLLTLFSLASRIDLPGDIAGDVAQQFADQFPDQCSQTANKETRNDPDTGIYSSLDMNDPEYREIVLDFLSRLDERLDMMDEGVERQQWQDVASHAHWLRGTSGSLGYTQFSTPTRAIESLAARADSPACELVMQDIRSIANRIMVPAQ